MRRLIPLLLIIASVLGAMPASAQDDNTIDQRATIKGLNTAFADLQAQPALEVDFLQTVTQEITPFYDASAPPIDSELAAVVVGNMVRNDAGSFDIDLEYNASFTSDALETALDFAVDLIVVDDVFYARVPFSDAGFPIEWVNWSDDPLALDTFTLQEAAEYFYFTSVLPQTPFTDDHIIAVAHIDEDAVFTTIELQLDPATVFTSSLYRIDGLINVSELGLTLDDVPAFLADTTLHQTIVLANDSGRVVESAVVLSGDLSVQIPGSEDRIDLTQTVRNALIVAIPDTIPQITVPDLDS